MTARVEIGPQHLTLRNGEVGLYSVRSDFAGLPAAVNPDQSPNNPTQILVSTKKSKTFIQETRPGDYPRPYAQITLDPNNPSISYNGQITITHINNPRSK